MYPYIGCNGHVSAIDPSSGDEVWRTSLSTGALSSFTSTIGQDVCILEHEGKIYAGCYGHLFAIDADTGDIVWKNELTGLGYNDVTLAIAGKSIHSKS